VMLASMSVVNANHEGISDLALEVV